MDIFLSIGAFLLSIIGIAGCILPLLPGVALSYVGLLCAYFCSYSTLTPATLWIFLGVTVAVSIADYFLPALMTRLFGGSRAGATGATVGLIVGLLLGNIPGMILGPLVGAVVGEMLHDNSSPAKAMLVGAGSFLAFIVGTGLKLVASVAMFAVVIQDTWQPLKNWFVQTF